MSINSMDSLNIDDLFEEIKFNLIIRSLIQKVLQFIKDFNGQMNFIMIKDKKIAVSILKWRGET